MYTDDRNAYRHAFYQSWRKYQKQVPLEPFEKNIVEAILIHPEYQPLLACENGHPENYDLTDNPFFHLGLHIAINEQLRTNRPAGIQEIYQLLQERYEHNHAAQHVVMETLASYMWETQQQGIPMEEAEYLKRLHEILHSTAK